jgi:hypothetical protein
MTDLLDLCPRKPLVSTATRDICKLLGTTNNLFDFTAFPCRRRVLPNGRLMDGECVRVELREQCL